MLCLTRALAAAAVLAAAGCTTDGPADVAAGAPEPGAASADCERVCRPSNRSSNYEGAIVLSCRRSCDSDR